MTAGSLLSSSSNLVPLLLLPKPPSKPFLLRSPGIRLPPLLPHFCTAAPKYKTKPPPPPRPKKTGGSSGPGAGGGSSRSRGPRRSSYGASRSSSIKKTFAQEQVVFNTPVPADPVVAIIGGGVSGIICASTLAERGIRSTVFDTGIHGLGGRMATRVIDPQPLVFDHAAQFFTASDPRFQELVDKWLQKGLIREWKGLLGELEAGGNFTPISSTSARYIGLKGMRPLMDSILSQSSLISIVRPCWISELEPFNGRWRLIEREKPHGQFDAIVIAHNGKCANRLLSSSGLPLLTKQMKRLELSAIWALLAAFQDPLPIPQNGQAGAFEGAFVKGIDSLSWMANNTRKLFPSQRDMPECWTFFSTAAYGRRNKVPQENIPKVTADKVQDDILKGVESSLGLSEGSLKKPVYTRVQLWGAALPVNTPGIPCIFDPNGRAGICGDWLLGSSVEAAALSGIYLANHIADYFQTGGILSNEFAIGLNDAFHVIDGHDIGQFPGLNCEKQILEAQECTAS